jgi:hypothetical protein
MKKGTSIQLLIVSIGLIASLSYFFTEKKRIEEQSIRDFKTTFFKRHVSIQEKFNKKKIILDSIKKFFEASTKVDFDEFSIFTSNILDQYQVEEIC